MVWGLPLSKSPRSSCRRFATVSPDSSRTTTGAFSKGCAYFEGRALLRSLERRDSLKTDDHDRGSHRDST